MIEKMLITSPWNEDGKKKAAKKLKIKISDNLLKNNKLGLFFCKILLVEDRT